MKSRLPLPDVGRLDPPQQAVYQSIMATRGNLSGPFLAELLESNRIGDGLYEEGVRELGVRGMVELVGIVGYYSLVAMTLNAFDMRMA